MNKNVLPVLILGFFFIFAGLVFAQGTVKPFDWSQPDFQPVFPKEKECPESEWDIRLWVSRCIMDICYNEPIIGNPLICKDRCQNQGVNKLMLYNECVKAEQQIEKEKREELNAFIVQMGGNLSITHADGTWENYAGGDINKRNYSDSDIKEIKEGDSLMLNQGNSSSWINFPDGSELYLGAFTILKFSNIEKAGLHTDTTTMIQGLEYAGFDTVVVEIPKGKLRMKIFNWGKTKFWTTEFNETLEKAREIIDEAYQQKLEEVKREIVKNYKVKTPSATVSAKGTDFIVEHNPDTNITNVYVFEGTVEVNNLKDKTIDLPAGKSATIDGNGQIVLGDLNQEQINQLKTELSPEDSPWEETSQTGTTTQETVPKSSTKTSIWIYILAIVIVVFGIIGGFKVFKKK